MRTPLAAVVAFLLALPALADEPKLIRSAKNGSWSDATTWEGGHVPAAGANVQIRPAHRVVYDVKSDRAIRFLHVAGVLSFDPNRDTRLDVGLIKIQPGDNASEDGFDCDHVMDGNATPRAALEVGTQEKPIAPGKTALIRLVYFEGMKKESCPAIVCCGGRMDFHGAELSRTWTKLGGTAKKGDTTVTLSDSVSGWRAGDRIIITATTRQNKQLKTFRESLRSGGQTEERIIEAITGTKLTLDKPLEFEHIGDGEYRAEVANLSRNVIVESGDVKVRGHTMYHRGSAGSISYAEFRHLGKEGVLGRYSLHFHLVGDSMRGSSVIGASIWDSGNRWLTIHGTNYLVVRDCVGYQSVGHGYFLEDGTEVYNVLDHNLPVQAFIGKPLPKQVIPFDKNDGAGFWWANSHNSVTHNVACECDEYGYFFQCAKTADFDPMLNVQQPDGSKKRVDIRKLPFVRFEGNESHCQRRHAFDLGGGAPFGPPNVAGVGPDEHHPFVIRSMKVWNVHWGIHLVSPCVQVDGLQIHDAHYGLWRTVYRNHAYHNVSIDAVPKDTVNAFPEGDRPSEEVYPKPLDAVDDLPPITVITHLQTLPSGEVHIRGTTSDNGTVKRVRVNGQEAKAAAANFAQWEITLPANTGQTISAFAEDAAGNVEKRPHVLHR
ncbi:MAG TPA: G8 domain-containing protein [Gemmataceae bacterium]|jgi:hypothetical protein|nr:G8 domain-containing protein [Gemmataceae bacterium]